MCFTGPNRSWYIKIVLYESAKTWNAFEVALTCAIDVVARCPNSPPTVPFSFSTLMPIFILTYLSLSICCCISNNIIVFAFRVNGVTKWNEIVEEYCLTCCVCSQVRFEPLSIFQLTAIVGCCCCCYLRFWFICLSTPPLLLWRALPFLSTRSFYSFIPSTASLG